MSQHISNTNIHQRMTQAVVVGTIILVGILYSELANAQKSIRAIKYNTIKYDKAKHRTSIHKDSDMACYILHKKRTSIPKHPLIASEKRSKSRPMAETDEPRLASSN